MVRKAADRVGTAIPLPDINPNILSGLSVVLSMLFVLFLGYPQAAASFLGGVLVLDWLDGLLARKHNRVTEEGYLADVASDRFSEAIVFLPFFFPWFYLFCINCMLALLSVKRRKHIILPLRHIFLVFYAFFVFSGQV